MTETFTITEGLAHYIEEWREKPGNLIMVLHKAQEEYGYLPREIAAEIGKMLKIPLAKIYGVISFYHLFRTEKPGKHKVAVCMGTACYMKGAGDLVKELECLLDVKVQETTADGKITLEAVRCVGCCGLAPVMSVNGKIHGELKEEKIPAILAEECKEEGFAAT